MSVGVLIQEASYIGCLVAIVRLSSAPYHLPLAHLFRLVELRSEGMLVRRASRRAAEPDTSTVPALPPVRGATGEGL